MRVVAQIRLPMLARRGSVPQSVQQLRQMKVRIGKVGVAIQRRLERLLRRGVIEIGRASCRERV